MVLRLAIHDADELVVHGLGSMLRRYETVRLLDGSSYPVDITLYDPSVPTHAPQDPVAHLRRSGRAGAVVVYTWNFQP